MRPRAGHTGREDGGATPRRRRPRHFFDTDPKSGTKLTDADAELALGDRLLALLALAAGGRGVLDEVGRSLGHGRALLGW